MSEDNVKEFRDLRDKFIKMVDEVESEVLANYFSLVLALFVRLVRKAEEFNAQKQLDTIFLSYLGIKQLTDLAEMDGYFEGAFNTLVNKDACLLINGKLATESEFVLQSLYQLGGLMPLDKVEPKEQLNIVRGFVEFIELYFGGKMATIDERHYHLDISVASSSLLTILKKIPDEKERKANFNHVFDGIKEALEL